MPNKELEKILKERFLNKYNSSLGTFIEKDSNRYLESWKFPKIFMEEIYMLYFLYDKRYKWSTDIPTINNYIKKNIKNLTFNSMLNKIKDNEKYYFELRDFLEKRKKFNNKSSFDYIDTAPINYIYFALYRVIKNVPEYIKNSEKYNL